MLWMLMTGEAREPVDETADVLARVFVDGQVVLLHHGSYCSYPRAPGLTTRSAAPLPTDEGDAVFSVASLERGFSGVVYLHHGEPVRALPLEVVTDLRLPSPSVAQWETVFRACRLHTLEGAGLPELLRRVNPATRSVIVRVLTNQALEACGIGGREGLVEAAIGCGGGRCDAFVTWLGELRSHGCM